MSSDLMKTYFAMGGKPIQFNIVSTQTLRVTPVKPERHGDLVVGGAGRSAYFIQLGHAVQEEISGRTEHTKLT